MRASALLYAGFAAVAWLWRTGYRGESLLRADPNVAVHWLRDPALGLATAGLVIWLSAELTNRTGMGRALARALGAAIGRLDRRHAIALAATSAIGEEAFFRGALQPEIGLVWASVVFALAHLVPRRELLPWCAFSFGAGLLLGGLYDSTGNLVAPVVAHFAINAVNLQRLSREYGAPPA